MAVSFYYKSGQYPCVGDLIQFTDDYYNKEFAGALAIVEDITHYDQGNLLTINIIGIDTYYLVITSLWCWKFNLKRRNGKELLTWL